jgi:DNA processing protein
MVPLAPEDIRAWLSLLGCGLESHLLTTMLEDAPHPLDLLETSDNELVRRFQLSPRQVAAFRRLPSPKEIDRRLALMDQHGIALLPIGHPDFPTNLFKMRTSPPAVFLKGKIESYDTLAIGIVGPRMATPYGIDVARRLARDFADTLTVVSGAALGIDSAAHEAVLEAGGRTIAVLGCGIDIDYPIGNRRLRERIASGEAGALVSIFPPGEKPLRHNFPIRNYVLAGLSLAVIIVEAGKRSGALVTARAAGEEGRTVYAVPGDITRRNSEGSNALLRDGATVCTCAEDVIADLEITLHDELENLRRRREKSRRPADAAASPAGESDEMPTGNGALEEFLLREIQHHPISYDELMARLVPDRASVGDLSTALLMLELQGRIQQQPGRVYTPKL